MSTCACSLPRALILPGFVAVTFPSRLWAARPLALVAAITLANVAVVTGVWLSYRADFAAAKTSFLALPKGAKVLIGHSGGAGDPPRDLTEYPIYSVPILAVQYADAFVPNLFTEAGKQPVSARQPWKRLDVPYGGPVPVALLERIAEHGAPAETPAFIRSWARDFDFLYLVGPKIKNPMPDRLGGSRARAAVCAVSDSQNAQALEARSKQNGRREAGHLHHS